MKFYDTNAYQQDVMHTKVSNALLLVCFFIIDEFLTNFPRSKVHEIYIVVHFTYFEKIVNCHRGSVNR